MSDAWPVGLPPLARSEPIGGGHVGRVWRGTLIDGRDVVVKHCPYPAEVEAAGLLTLAVHDLPVPEVLGVAGGVLVMARVAGPPDWAGMGGAIARMHRVTGPRYGWHCEGYGGRCPLPNTWEDDWPTFFAENRVRTHLDDRTVPARLRERLHRACDGPLRALLPHRPPPSLTHGDLWAGNVVEGRWLVDPELSFTDRELDLAKMHSSPGLPPALFRAYESVWPLDPGYPRRQPALRLHSLLLQVRHFGPERAAAIEAVLDSYGW